MTKKLFCITLLKRNLRIFKSGDWIFFSLPGHEISKYFSCKFSKKLLNFQIRIWKYVTFWKIHEDKVFWNFITGKWIKIPITGFDIQRFRFNSEDEGTLTIPFNWQTMWKKSGKLRRLIEAKVFISMIYDWIYASEFSAMPLKKIPKMNWRFAISAKRSQNGVIREVLARIVRLCRFYERFSLQTPEKCIAAPTESPFKLYFGFRGL